ncbi:amidohydrolase family protein [Halioxenophilus sp. WMMB6]|uniref:amidohydrolase family protein n=1 Tax=Halioxenophilus sp. WMMB6 TaxID=3073815 RepID=UPI00295E6686|nr:amidohydrolase family protein [Halioxenophilus sp. WMMB6]
MKFKSPLQANPKPTWLARTLIGLSLAAGAQLAAASSTAIINATLYTATEQGTLSNASLVFEDGVITAINPEQITADEIIDAQGGTVTPGFIGSLNSLGLVEVGAVEQSEDDELEKPDLNFAPVLAFNPESTAIAVARSGGVTRDVVVPGGSKEPFAGVAGAVTLTGELALPDSKPVAAVTYLTGMKGYSRADTLRKLYQQLQARIDEVSKPKKGDEPAAAPSAAQLTLDALLAGSIPLLAYSDRPADILQLLALQEHFKLKLVIAGGTGAVAVKEQLAAAGVPVILDALHDLPESFDQLHASLSNASTLHQAGVTVGLAVMADATQALYQLRFGAGNAIANGLPPEAALAAITRVPAAIFGLPAGSLEAGKAADLVLWRNDPFDFPGQVQNLWIEGQLYGTQTRPDQLRERYRADAELPPAYRK